MNALLFVDSTVLFDGGAALTTRGAGRLVRDATLLVREINTLDGMLVPPCLIAADFKLVDGVSLATGVPAAARAGVGAGALLEGVATMALEGSLFVGDPAMVLE